jgi:multidrug efflux pump
MLVTGMIIGSLFTLFVVPSIYMLVARTRVAVASEAAEEEQPLLPEFAKAAL